MTEPLITIALTCYNAADTIARAIDSAAAQDWPNKEILIADDFSTDGSRAVILKKIETLPYARLIENRSNKGSGGTRNVLLSEARGAFIAFFDDDDESMAARVRTQYERIVAYENQTGENIVACYASGVRHYPNGYKKDLPAIGSKPVIPKGEGLAKTILYYGSKQENWDYGSGTPTCCLMARTQTLRDIGGFDETFRRVEDLDLAIRLALNGASFIGCAETLFIQHSTQGGDKTSLKNLEAELKLAEKYEDFLRSQNMYDYARAWPKIRHYHFTRQYGLFVFQLLALLLRHPVKTATHILDTGPKRLRHEKRMAA